MVTRVTALRPRAAPWVVIVQFWQESNWQCKQLRPIFKNYSAVDMVYTYVW